MIIINKKYFLTLLQATVRTCFIAGFTYQINATLLLSLVRAEKIEHKYGDRFKTKLRIDCRDSQ